MTSFDIYPASALDDAEQLREVLESSIRNPLTNEVIHEDVDDTLAALHDVIHSSSDRYYAIAARSGEQAVGMMGLQSPGESMRKYTTTSNPIEIINAYVLSSERGAGIGKALVEHLETKAGELSHTEVIVNSGPRYRFSGWPFWIRTYGEPAAIAKDYYGPGFDAAVWRKPLVDEK